MPVYTLPLIDGKYMDVKVDVSHWSSDPGRVEFYDLVWVVRSGPRWPITIGISIPRMLWDTTMFGTVAARTATTRQPYPIHLYEAVLEALWADPDYWEHEYDGP